MKLIAACNKGRTEKSERRVEQKTGSRQGHPPGAQPKQTDHSVAEEVSALAYEVVNRVPTRIVHYAEEVLVDPAQGTACIVGPKEHRRFQGDHTDAEQDWKPCTQPELD